MGSLSLASAIGGAGKGMQSNVENRMTMQRDELNRAHDLQLENMRATANRNLQSDEQTYRTDAAEIRVGAEQKAAETASQKAIDLQTGAGTIQEGIAAGDRTSRESISGARDDTSRFVALVGAYTSRSKLQGVNTKGGWSVKVSEGAQSFAEDGSTVTGPPVLIATKGSSSWQQLGDKMFRAGGATTPDKGFSSPEKEREIIDDLMANLGDKKIEQDFIDAVGWLPTRYFEALTLQSDGLSEFLKEFESGPAYDMSGGGSPDAGGGKETVAAPTGGGRLSEGESLREVSIKPRPRKAVSPVSIPDPYAGFDSTKAIGNWWEKNQLTGAKASEEFLKKQQGNKQ